MHGVLFPILISQSFNLFLKQISVTLMLSIVTCMCMRMACDVFSDHEANLSFCHITIYSNSSTLSTQAIYIHKSILLDQSYSSISLLVLISNGGSKSASGFCLYVPYKTIPLAFSPTFYSIVAFAFIRDRLFHRHPCSQEKLKISLIAIF